MLENFEELPIKELIAEKPAYPRDSSNLMIVVRKTGEIFHDKFFNLGNYLNSGDCLILNKSKVWKAKLPARKKTGGAVEFLLVSCENESKTIWKLLSRKSKPKDEYEAPGQIKARCLSQNEDGSFIFEFSSPLDEEYLNRNALIPLPNYIEKKRKEKGLSPYLENDCELYQTVYAEKEGSIAAPTAGFHFTKSLLNSLSLKGVIVSYVTLHVGWGTFRPVRTDPKEHKMLAEQCEISQEEAKII
ncbi:MAG: S-adenosylmethionine:tRNA ribosyltransferase-isomerase, partial [Elusimicrobia bacterium]|nr:S-adenosylmethionine:tRNA ribosyltransferase-isomerase [Elusimicrobiota bacterium]